MGNNPNNTLYQLQTYYSQDNYVFDSLYSHFFDPLYAGELYGNSTQVKIPQNFRIDLAISDLTVDFSMIKIVSILNEKPQGIFSYSENDVVYVPSSNTILFVNTENSQLHTQNITLNAEINSTLQSAFSELQENLSKLDTTQIYKYIVYTNVLYLFVENDEYQVNQKYEGLV